MNILLGLTASENLISELNRKFNIGEIEVKEVVETDNGTLYEYVTGKKKSFSFNYDKILDDDLDIILTEFNRQTTLSLKVENAVDVATYDTYTVLFTEEPDYKLWKELSIEGTKHFIYENCKFSLIEKAV